MADAARELGLRDAGLLLRIMRERGLQSPSIDPIAVTERGQLSSEALRKAMRQIPLNAESK